MSLAEEMQAVADEAGGILDVALVRLSDLDDLLARTLLGSLTAARLLMGAVDTMTIIDKAPKRNPMLCACCPRKLPGPGYTVALAIPLKEDPQNHIAFAICHRCGTSYEELRPRIAEALRRMFPYVQPFTITHSEGGRA